jgi:hypothetical protein
MATYICIYPSGYSLSGAELSRYGATHRYTSMSAMEAGEDVDWITATDNPVVEIIGGDVTNNWSTAGADTNTVNFSGWTLSQTYYLTIISIGTARNDYSTGKWSADAYRMEVADASCIVPTNATSFWLHVDGLQLKVTGTTGFRNTFYPNDDMERLEICNCFLVNEGSGSGDNVIEYIPSSGAGLAYFWNNICTNGVNGIWQRAGTVHSYHNTIYNMSSDGIESDGLTSYCINNAVFNNVDDFQDAFTTLDSNASDSAEGTNAVNLNSNASGEWTASFTDYANYDFTVKDASSLLYNAGGSITPWTTLTGDSDPLGADIKGDTRATTDIGAFVLLAAGGVSIPVIMHHRQQQGQI